jgi:hypothetical protein
MAGQNLSSISFQTSSKIHQGKARGLRIPHKRLQPLSGARNNLKKKEKEKEP